MSSFEWVCPFCDRNQVVISENHDTTFEPLGIGKSVHGLVGIRIVSIRCASPSCNEVTVIAQLTGAELSRKSGEYEPIAPLLGRWNLRPESSAKPQPSYIPAPLREDYLEACKIRELSPKASATLSRRCLQGMIRDFCKIHKSRLIDEIKELRRLDEEGHAPKGVESETLDAIDAVRSIGNIGAHMEKDIGFIIDVDPTEAQALIELIEMLFSEWYVARHRRTERLEKVKAIAADKANRKNGRDAPAGQGIPQEDLGE
ncbi:DUF4145 domain-containing protein [Phyllobacterium sp. A18/5-2]|uniref:DUF4145 domain-containing protein n=1 Tax=Phyllobacterium sp. A18/5-2 TaxID=2978392 RepID=UPI0021C5E852|nr:DUF4145 domain-containing protein [Phyllobacterium sp. A18/5-2]UXN62933.1 DUF4145 domain-containing protein [Phyllobacterium sp. A18/5-2]